MVGRVNSDWAEIMSDFFGINNHWIATGEHPTLLTGGGIVGTVTISSDESVAGLRWPENYCPNFATRKDPRAGGDSPPAAEDIANWLRKNTELRKKVEKLLAEDPLDSLNANHKS